MCQGYADPRDLHVRTDSSIHDTLPIWDCPVESSFMASPAALLMAKNLVPAGALKDAGHEGSEEGATKGTASSGPVPAVSEDEEEPPTNVLDAAARGAGEGLKLAANVGEIGRAHV